MINLKVKEEHIFVINKNFYQKALLQNSTNSETFVRLGKAYNALGDRRTAFDRFARAVELNRNDYKSYYEIGIIFNDMNKKKDAQVVLDNALRIKPDFTEAKKLDIYDEVKERVEILLPKANKFHKDTLNKLYPRGLEYTVGVDTKLAGNIDMLCWNDEAKEIQIWDYKNTKGIETYSSYNNRCDELAVMESKKFM